MVRYLLLLHMVYYNTQNVLMVKLHLTTCCSRIFCVGICISSLMNLEAVNNLHTYLNIIYLNFSNDKYVLYFYIKESIFYKYHKSNVGNCITMTPSASFRDRCILDL